MICRFRADCRRVDGPAACSPAPLTGGPVGRARPALTAFAAAETAGIPAEGDHSYPYWAGRLAQVLPGLLDHLDGRALSDAGVVLSAE